jgi:hypothetical protein
LVETFDAEMLSIYGKMCGWLWRAPTPRPAIPG